MSQYDTTGTDPFAELLPAYALGALEPAEAAQVEAHLTTCSTCPGELAAFEAAAGAFALSLEPVAVPAGHEARFQQKLSALEPLAEPAGHRERFLDKLDAQAGPAAEPAGPRRAAVPPTPPGPAPAPARRWWQALDPRAGWAAA